MGMGHSDPPLPRATVELYERAGRTLGCEISRVMQYGPVELLQRPLYAHPATFLAGIAVFYDALNSGIIPDFLAGYSLGDFTAVVASGALSLEEGLKILKLRSSIMDQACKHTPGQMSAIKSLNEAAVCSICINAALETNGTCEIAAINSDSDIVISGTREAVNNAAEHAGKAGAMVTEIAVPGPFHSSLMKGAEREFAEIIGTVRFKDPQFAIICDSSKNGVINSREGLKDFLTAQISRSIDWKRKTSVLREMGVSVLCEMGSSLRLARITSGEIPGSAFYEIESHRDLAALAAGAAIRER